MWDTVRHTFLYAIRCACQETLRQGASLKAASLLFTWMIGAPIFYLLMSREKLIEEAAVLVAFVLALVGLLTVVVFTLNLVRCANQRFRVQQQYSVSGEIVIAPAYFDALTDSARDSMKIKNLLSEIGKHLNRLFLELREHEAQAPPFASQPQGIAKFIRLRRNHAERLLHRNKKMEQLLEKLEPISERHHEGVRHIVDGHPLYGHLRTYTADDMSEAEANLPGIRQVMPQLDDALVKLNRWIELETEPINITAYQRSQSSVERVRTVIVRVNDAAKYALRDKYGSSNT